MIQTLIKYSDQCIKLLWQKKMVLLAKIGLLKQFWSMLLRFLRVITDGKNNIEKSR